MVFFYSLVSAVGVKRYRIAYAFPYSIFKHLEIMPVAFCFLRVNDLPAVLFNYDLRLQRMPFFSPE
jgi:hypothetical protein